MARAARRNGADVRLTIDPDVHHEAWEKAYASDAMWEWLLAQKKTDKDDQTVARKHLAAARRSGFGFVELLKIDSIFKFGDASIRT